MIILFMDLSAEEQSKLLQIYELYGKLMHLIALEYFKNDIDMANDCVQDSFERIATYINIIGEPESKSTKAYVRKVVESVAKNMLKREATVEFCEEETFELYADQEAVRKHGLQQDSELQNTTVLKDFMRDLTEEEKILIWYRYKGVPYKDIAQKLGISETTCRKRMERLARKLRRYNRHAKLKEV